MEVNLKPVKVDITIDNPILGRSAFYNLCFIAENNTAPRTIEVKNLSELLEAGFTRLDLAYNFCVGVFSQEGIPSVFIRSKRSNETYSQAYDSDNNEDYYYVVIQSKSIVDITSFSNHLNSSYEDKLHFYSQKTIVNNQSRLVNYFQDYAPPIDGATEASKDYYLNKAYLGVEATNIPSTITVSGLFEVGAILTATVADIDGVPVNEVTYSWLSDGIQVGVENNYLINSLDYEKTISVRASFVDFLGFSEVATSTLSSPVIKISLTDYLLDSRADIAVEYAVEILNEISGV